MMKYYVIILFVFQFQFAQTEYFMTIRLLKALLHLAIVPTRVQKGTL